MRRAQPHQMDLFIMFIQLFSVRASFADVLCVLYNNRSAHNTEGNGVVSSLSSIILSYMNISDLRRADYGCSWLASSFRAATSLQRGNNLFILVSSIHLQHAAAYLMLVYVTSNRKYCPRKLYMYMCTHTHTPHQTGKQE